MSKKVLKSVTNAINTLGETDVSDGLSAKDFRLDDLSRFGVDAPIVAFAYDPIQSLLALATEGCRLYVLGQQHVQVSFELDPALVRHVAIIQGLYLVSVDSRGVITVFSLDLKRRIGQFALPGEITAFHADPALEWVLCGLHTGQVCFFDVSTCQASIRKVDNLQTRMFGTRSGVSQVRSVMYHPRDPGRLLIAYDKCVVVYLIAENTSEQTFVYTRESGEIGSPCLQAAYHPSGSHVVSVHADGSLVFWDAQHGDLLISRSVSGSKLAAPQLDPQTATSVPEILRLAWICFQAPDTTALVIGSRNRGTGICSVDLLDFGPTPPLLTTSYEKMGAFYANPKRQKRVEFNQNQQIDSLLPVPRLFPFFGGGLDPTALLVLFASGEISAIGFPQFAPLLNPAQLPPAFSLVASQVTAMRSWLVSRSQWIGMLSASASAGSASASISGGSGGGSASSGVSEVGIVLQGGAPVVTKRRVREMRTAVAFGHENGVVSLWDSVQAELPNTAPLSAYVGLSLGRANAVAVTEVAFAPETAELAVACRGGEVVLFRFGRNPNFRGVAVAELIASPAYRQASAGLQTAGSLFVAPPTKLLPPDIKDGFMPTVIVRSAGAGTTEVVGITCLEFSNIGFVGIGYSNGRFLIVDTRGPGVVLDTNIRQSEPKPASGSKLPFRRRKHAEETPAEAFATAVDFSVFAIDGDGYSSIVATVGTSDGALLQYKLLPLPSGAFKGEFVAASRTDGGVVRHISAYSPQTAGPLFARTASVDQLSRGVVVPGVLVAATDRGMHVARSTAHGLKPVAHADLRSSCGAVLAAGLCTARLETRPEPRLASYIAVLAENAFIRVFSLPELREISTISLPFIPDRKLAETSATILNSGDVVLLASGTQAAVLSLTGTGVNCADFPSDELYDLEKEFPARPGFSAVQRAKGAKGISSEELADLLGGAVRRKPLKAFRDRSEAELEAAAAARRRIAGDGAGSRAGSGRRNQGGYLDSVSKSANNWMQSVSDSLNDISEGLNDSMDTSYSSGKNTVYKEMFKSKFGF